MSMMAAAQVPLDASTIAKARALIDKAGTTKIHQGNLPDMASLSKSYDICGSQDGVARLTYRGPKDGSVKICLSQEDYHSTVMSILYNNGPKTIDFSSLNIGQTSDNNNSHPNSLQLQQIPPDSTQFGINQPYHCGLASLYNDHPATTRQFTTTTGTLGYDDDDGTFVDCSSRLKRFFMQRRRRRRYRRRQRRAPRRRFVQLALPPAAPSSTTLLPFPTRRHDLTLMNQQLAPPRSRPPPEPPPYNSF